MSSAHLYSQNKNLQISFNKLMEKNIKPLLHLQDNSVYFRITPSLPAQE